MTRTQVDQLPAAAIADAYRNGGTIAGLARQHQANRKTIRCILHAQQVPRVPFEEAYRRRVMPPPPGAAAVPVEEAKAAYLAGSSLAAIAARYPDAGVRAVRAVLVAAGVTLRSAGCGKGERRTDVSTEALIRDYKRGVPIATMVAGHKMSAPAIYRRLAKAQVPRRQPRAGVPSPRRTTVDLVEVKRLYVEEELSGAAIGRLRGVTARTVYNWLDAAGVPRRDRATAVRLASTRRTAPAAQPGPMSALVTVGEGSVHAAA